LQAEIDALNPTPLQDRPFYQAGEAVQRWGREIVPHLEGYDESSIATQLSRDLGSMVVGRGVSLGTGPAGRGVPQHACASGRSWV
jgi:hypothetical protein